PCTNWQTGENRASVLTGGDVPGPVSPAAQAKEGPLADKATQLMLDALSRAVAEPAGLPLFGSKRSPGLFVATSAARFAAQRCVDEHLVRVLRSEPRGKTTQDICAITDKGLQYLLTQVSPRQVLEDLV